MKFYLISVSWNYKNFSFPFLGVKIWTNRRTTFLKTTYGANNDFFLDCISLSLNAFLLVTLKTSNIYIRIIIPENLTLILV